MEPEAAAAAAAAARMKMKIEKAVKRASRKALQAVVAPPGEQFGEQGAELRARGAEMGGLLRGSTLSAPAKRKLEQAAAGQLKDVLRTAKSIASFERHCRRRTSSPNAAGAAGAADACGVFVTRRHLRLAIRLVA